MTRYGSSQTIMSEEWELCLDWLQRCKVLPYEFMGHNVSDFAQCLRDGVILCQLVTTLKPTIDDRDYSLRPQSSQVGFSLSFRISRISLGFLYLSLELRLVFMFQLEI